MKRASRLFCALGIVLLALAGLNGCATTDQARIGKLASIEVEAHSYAEVREAAIAVFVANGYEQTVGLVFEKKGSAMETVAYGSWSANAVWTRIKVSVDTGMPGHYIIGADAYTVKDHNQWIMEEEQKNHVSKRSECSRLLQQIKDKLAAGPDSPAAMNSVP